MDIETAIQVLTAAGYRVTKPRAPRAKQPRLNAVGKPYSPLYDPKYRVKYKTPRTAYGQSTAARGRVAGHQYRECIATRYPTDHELVKEICRRQGVQA